MSTGSIGMIGAADPQPPDRAKVKEIGAQFEALLVAQMLKQVRESGSGGWMGGGDDQAGSTMVAAAEEMMAQALAAQGGLGLAGLVEKALTPAVSVPAQEIAPAADK